MDYKEFKRKVEEFKSLFADAKSGHIEMVILDLINEFSPNFMEYKAKEMIEECDFDHDTVVRSHRSASLFASIFSASSLQFFFTSSSHFFSAFFFACCALYSFI